MSKKQSSILDKYAEFIAEVRRLEQSPRDLERQRSIKQAKLARLKAARSSQLALGEMKKAEVLAQEIEKLESEIEVLSAKIAAFGPGGRQSAQFLVANAEGSKLFELAKFIVEQAAEKAPALEKECQHFIDWVDQEKEKYLKKIEAFSNKLSDLHDIARAGLVAQQYLPEELRLCKKPRLISPSQGHFEIDVDRVCEVYRPLSRAFLPD